MINYKYWMALEQTKGIGIASLKEIYKVLESLSLSIVDIFELTIDEIADEFDFKNSIIDGIISAKSKIQEMDEIYVQLIESHIQPILFFENKYPQILLDKLKSNTPAIIYTYGNPDLLNYHGAALLGYSQISSKGEMIAFMAAKILSEHNIVTISGMSSGAGTTAHKSALENNGNTIAVIPLGILNFKLPKKIKEIFDPERILIISPFHPTEEISKYNAFIRNRLICSLSKAVYIIEAPEDEGIFEAGNSANKLEIPLFTTEYAEYPESAAGNKKLLSEFNAQPVRGKKENDLLVPNLDMFIGKIKF